MRYDPLTVNERAEIERAQLRRERNRREAGRFLLWVWVPIVVAFVLAMYWAPEIAAYANH